MSTLPASSKFRCFTPGCSTVQSALTQRWCWLTHVSIFPCLIPRVCNETDCQVSNLPACSIVHHSQALAPSSRPGRSICAGSPMIPPPPDAPIVCLSYRLISLLSTLLAFRSLHPFTHLPSAHSSVATVTQSQETRRLLGSAGDFTSPASTPRGLRTRSVARGLFEEQDLDEEVKWRAGRACSSVFRIDGCMKRRHAGCFDNPHTLISERSGAAPCFCPM